MVDSSCGMSEAAQENLGGGAQKKMIFEKLIYQENKILNFLEIFELFLWKN